MNNNRIFGANRNNANMTIRDGSANFIVAYLLQFLLQFLFMIVLVMTDVGEEFQTTLLYTCLICFINEMANFITPLAYSKVLGQNYMKDIGFKWNLSFVQVIVLVLIAIFTICAFSPIANWFVEFIYWTGFDSSSLASMEYTTISELIIGIVFVCVLPAIAEEIMYRGIIARSFTSKNYIFAILMSSFIFAIMHGNPVQLIHQFCMGVVCCTVYFMTRSIYSSIIVHFTNNFIAVIGNYILYKCNVVEISDWYYVGIMVAGLIVLPVLIVYFGKISAKRKGVVISDKDLNLKFQKLFKSEKETIEEDKLQEQIDVVLQELDTPEKKEVYLNTVNENKQKNSLIDKRALIFAIILGMAVWIINTVMCYI